MRYPAKRCPACLREMVVEVAACSCGWAEPGEGRNDLWIAPVALGGALLALLLLAAFVYRVMP